MSDDDSYGGFGSGLPDEVKANPDVQAYIESTQEASGEYFDKGEKKAAENPFPYAHPNDPDYKIPGPKPPPPATDDDGLGFIPMVLIAGAASVALGLILRRF